MEIQGNVRAEGVIRIDRWTSIEGDVSTKGGAYVGDRVRIKGKLYVEGSLDIGSEVEIGEYEAKGWINIRSPIPILIYIVIYLMDLLRHGKSEEVDKILNELEEAEEDIIISPGFFFMPDKAEIGAKGIQCDGMFRLGDETRLRARVEAGGDVHIGFEADLSGDVISEGNVVISHGANIIGDIKAQDMVMVNGETRILGDIHGAQVEVESSANIEGTIIAPNGVRLITPETKLIEGRLDRFEHGIGDMDTLLE